MKILFGTIALVGLILLYGTIGRMEQTLSLTMADIKYLMIYATIFAAGVLLSKEGKEEEK